MKKKIYQISLIILIIILLIFLFHSISLNNYDNFLPVITTIIVFFLPMIIEKIFKINIPYSLKTFYIIFIFLSKYLGGNNFYYSTVPLYDKIIHSVYGIFAFFVSIFILVKNKNSSNIWFNILFAISVALATSIIWEFLEFAFDKILHQNGQRLETGIDDTMFDLISPFLTTIILSIFYYIENKFNKDWVINKFIKSLN